MEPEDDPNWFWCSTCKTTAYSFDCCGNTSCNGGGCDECVELARTVHEMLANGTAPDLEPKPSVK